MDSFNDMDMIEVMACETLVPFYDMPVSCGLPTGTGDIPPEMIKVPGNDNNLVDTYAIRAQGDSMIGVGIFDGHLPNEAELRRMAVGCFSKEFAKWTDEKAPVHGKNYLGYYDAGEAMLRKLP